MPIVQLTTIRAGVNAILTRVWADQRIGAAAAFGATVGWAADAGLWTPRGPLTTGQAI
jgi:hypothetical protein